MNLDDLPILRTGTRIKPDSQDLRKAEIAYHGKEGDIQLCGYALGILPSKNYVDAERRISYSRSSNWDRRLLLIREIIVSDQGEVSWNEAMEMEIPLREIVDYSLSSSLI